LCITGTAATAVENVIAVTATLYGDLPVDFVATATSALQAAFANFPIASDSGAEVAKSQIDAVLHAALPSPKLRKVTLVAPAADVAYTVGQVPKLGVVTLTDGGP
jgi:hypothetical protein